ncbi:MAG: shikimate dehydrogenase [Hyphomonadaceae bacterium]|nr:shikimate dehydrogenase [Hyphomonadaceae bacterium]
MKRACVIGWPVEHSRSPLIHGYWLERYGINGSYGRQPVAPADLPQFLRTLRDKGFAGCNVTLPHKEAAFAAAAETRPAARAAGAANTLWFEGGRLVADNTDSAGFMSSLHAACPSLQLAGATVAVLGAGGAARGIVLALIERGVCEVLLFNRTRARAEAVAAGVGARVKVHDWGARADRSRDAALLVNTTSLGMKGAGTLDMDVSALDPTCVVADIVYVPLETPLLAAARARGLATVDGLGMLLHQAVPGFEKWFGVRPEVTAELRALLQRDIEGA